MVSVKTADILTIEIDQSILPMIVQELADLIGLNNALKLVDHYKGVRMWVPVEFRDDHVLCKIVGHAATVKLVQNFPGMMLEIPSCHEALLTVRNATIIRSDKSTRQLAIEYDLSERQIRYIKAKCAFDYDERQERLF